MSFRRLLVLAPCLALSACATDAPVSKAEVSALQAELRMMRESQQRMETRLRRLESEAVVSSARSGGAGASPSEPSPGGGAAARVEARGPVETPELTVVKLKPRREPAPKLKTQVPVAEPSADELAMLGAVKGAEDALELSHDGSELPEKDASLADVLYEDGIRALKTGNVEGGAEKLRLFAEENPQHSLADNALYFRGLGLMGLSDHKAAASSFEELIARYPAGDAVVDAMLKLAECRTRLNQKDDARALYTKIVLNYPGTAAATQAEQRLVALSR